MKFRLIESKADQQKLIDFAGEKIATQFFDNRKFYKSPENDIYFWLKKSPEELKDFMEKHKTTNQKTKSEIEQILESPKANDVDLIANQDGYTIYKINTPEASVKYGLIVGGKAGWCISGGYYDGKEDGGILEEARHYFDDYLKGTYEAYYFVIGHNTKYALCVKSINNNQAKYDIWDQTDNTVRDIPYLSDLYDEDDVLLYKQIKEFEISNGTLIKFNNVNNVSEVTIPNNVTSIGNSAFDKCTELTSVTIPDSVTIIEDWAFHKCTRLKSITIPDSVESIGDNAFSNCFGLTSVTIPDSVTSIGCSVFQECKGLTSVTIGNRLTSIESYTFWGCTNLMSVTIPDSVNSIKFEAFCNCISLTNIIIPNSVENIEMFAFCNCKSLTSVTIGNRVTYIGKDAFYGCNKLKSITIPFSATNIVRFAFRGCKNLTSIIFKGTKSQWQKITDNIDLGINQNKCVVHCADGDIQTEKNESYTSRLTKSHNTSRFKRRLN